jgi:hypothetical protein
MGLADNAEVHGGNGIQRYETLQPSTTGLTMLEITYRTRLFMRPGAEREVLL